MRLREIFTNTFFTDYLRATASVSTHFYSYTFDLRKRLCPPETEVEW